MSDFWKGVISTTILYLVLDYALWYFVLRHKYVLKHGGNDESDGNCCGSC